MATKLTYLALVLVACTLGLASGCSKGSDCAATECCVQGTCKRMGVTSSYCYVSQGYAWTRPEEMVADYDLCPCRTGEFCARIDRVHPEYGQMGMCTWG